MWPLSAVVAPHIMATALHCGISPTKQQAEPCTQLTNRADRPRMQAVHDLAKEDKESAWVGRLLCQVQ